MSEGSLPPFKYLDPRRYPARLRDAATRVLERLRRSSGGKRVGEPRDATGAVGKTAERPAAAPGGPRSAAHPGEAETGPRGGMVPGTNTQAPEETEVGEAERERAAAALQEFLAENSTDVERAARTYYQVERLEEEGTPSDSARNRAARAREEVVESLLRLRRSLKSSGGAGVARALDLEVTKLDPPIKPAEIHG